MAAMTPGVSVLPATSSKYRVRARRAARHGPPQQPAVVLEEQPKPFGHREDDDLLDDRPEEPILILKELPGLNKTLSPADRQGSRGAVS